MSMYIVLNGPLGIGKSTLAEALTENIVDSAMLSGDLLLALNPPPPNEIQYLHSTIALLVGHYRSFGYQHIVIEHFWAWSAQLADQRDRLMHVDAEADIRCFLLTLSADENLRRIELRQGARAIDEREFELGTFAGERDVLAKNSDLGEPFDVSGPPPELVARMVRRLGLS